MVEREEVPTKKGPREKEVRRKGGTSKAFGKGSFHLRVHPFHVIRISMIYSAWKGEGERPISSRRSSRRRGRNASPEIKGPREGLAHFVTQKGRGCDVVG